MLRILAGFVFAFAVFLAVGSARPANAGGGGGCSPFSAENFASMLPRAYSIPASYYECKLFISANDIKRIEWVGYETDNYFVSAVSAVLWEGPITPVYAFDNGNLIRNMRVRTYPASGINGWNLAMLAASRHSAYADEVDLVAGLAFVDMVGDTMTVTMWTAPKP